jgi:glycosyltransferase involved in cell wall biosynthesis
VFGGPHNLAMVLAKTLKTYGVTMTILVPDEPGTAYERLRDVGADVITMPLHRARASWDPSHHLKLVSTLPREVRAIRRIIRERSIDTVQVGGLLNPHSAIAAKLENVTLVWQVLDTRTPMSIRRIAMPFVVRVSDVIMTTGRAVARAHPGAERVGARLHPFFPPVDPDVFAPASVDRVTARAAFGLDAGDAVIGTVGNLNPQKGHDILLRAGALLRAGERDVKLLIVGASHRTHRSYEGALFRLSHDLGLVVGRDVVFTGELRDVRPALAAMDLFVLSSVPRSEGAPTVVEEAMMMELPVVAADVGAVRELVEDGETGFVVPPLAPSALAAAAAEILADQRLRERMGVCGRRRAVAMFTAEECARIHVAAYEAAMRHHSQSGDQPGCGRARYWR